MKKISQWAKNHIWPARIIIVAGILILNGAAILTGLLLKDLHVEIPASFFIVLVFISLMATFCYPAKKYKENFTPQAFYKRQKTNDVILLSAAFCMFVCISNHKNPVETYFQALNAVSASKPTSPKDSTLKNYKSVTAFSASIKDENGKLLKWKERKKLLKEQVKAIKKSKEISDGGKVALIILSVIVALGLVYLVAALACSLSCSGSDAAAVIVGIGGGALVIFLLILAIRAITGKKKKTIKSPPENQPATGS